MIIREAGLEDVEGIAKVHVDTWRTTYRGIIPDKHLATMTYSNHAERWKSYLEDNSNGSFTFIAEDDSGHVIGFVSGGPERTADPTYKGELYLIYILEEYHGKGMGRILIQSLVKKFLEEDITSMMLWVFADNHAARRFYEALEGQHIKTKEAKFGGVMLKEMAYGWTDIWTLLQN